MATMEKKGRRPKQSDAPVEAADDAADADEMMQRLLDDATGSAVTGQGRELEGGRVASERVVACSKTCCPLGLLCR